MASGKINRKRKAKKKNLVDAIVDYRVGKGHQQFHKCLEVVVPGTDRNLIISTKRLINILFGSAIKPLLTTRGGSLGKLMLEDGEMTDQSHIKKLTK